MTLLLIALAASQLGATGPGTSGECGWLVLSGNVLVARPEPSLKPVGSEPLPKPPVLARAAYCVRPTMMTYVGDERVLKLGLPLVIRSGSKEGVLEASPTVMFNYHKVGDRYFPGRARDQEHDVTASP